MQALEKASGVIGKPKRLFVTSNDVMKLLGCKKSYASKVIQDINAEAKQRGEHAFPAGKANKYIFAKTFALPMEDVESVMVEEQEE
ncbi:hypothetical protein C809_02186 [Lachnospiraceae bacterium MD335]|nr:hypothetical protein C809_02186 [Lachnospiraceae bacterium MD335]